MQNIFLQKIERDIVLVWELKADILHMFFLIKLIILKKLHLLKDTFKGFFNFYKEIYFT